MCRLARLDLVGLGAALLAILAGCRFPVLMWIFEYWTVVTGWIESRVFADLAQCEAARSLALATLEVLRRDIGPAIIGLCTRGGG